MPIVNCATGEVREETAEELAAIEAARIAAAALVPEAVTPLQMRRALREVGLKPAVDALLATLDEETVETWEYALEIQRANPLIAMAAAQLEMTSAQVDDLFRFAANL